MTVGLTFDTGALIALERKHAAMATVFALATKEGRVITVPSAVISEWWRGRSRRREDILESVDVEPLDERLAKLAGEAVAAIRGATPIDAIVMASASRRGDVIYTSDEADLLRLRGFFPNTRVRVMRV
jgi:predicted nucleic acid-binding protein